MHTFLLRISLILSIFLCSCGSDPPYTSVMNYIGGTVIDKSIRRIVVGCKYFARVRFLDSDSIYQVAFIQSSEYEYNLFSLGETIELETKFEAANDSII